ncbi:MAG: peptidylprolyl isomerase [Sutterellaceae bacterium]|nr:peptidylprolyl isomerase [Burkholderiaceae bacterium]MDW8429493.1 peptidylprolyl isomerase [Sutterellaceae bacterium]
MSKTPWFVALLFSAQVAFAQNVAVVNNKPIPKSREEAWIKQLQAQGQQDTPELRRMVREELIRREVFLQEAQKRGLADLPDVKFQIDIQRQNTLIQALMRDELKRNPVTEAQIQAEYERRKNLAGGKEYRARHILVEKEDEAKAIIERLKKGEKFEELAKQSKDPGSAARGGDLDWAGPDAYVKPFSDAMVKLEKGTFTEAPVQSPFGWHVIRLDDVRDAQFPPLAQVSAQIRESLQQQRIQSFLEELRKKANVQ